jgi:hypothetical protein
MVLSSMNVAMSLSIAGNKGNGGRVSYIFAIYINVCEFKSRRGKNKKWSPKRSNSNTV